MKPLFESSTLSLLEKVATFGERRHEVLAGNIANINTPNYRMRDLPVAEFQKALKQAVEQQRDASQINSPRSLQTNSAAANRSSSIEELFPDQLFQAVQSPAGNITSQDGNNRSVEQEMMKLTKNNMVQNVAIELMRAQYGLLQAAISERV